MEKEKVLKRVVNKETILYLFFGVLTTIVNFGSYVIFDIIFGRKYYLISNIFSFIMATSFAFVTNKQFVFKSKIWKWEILAKEIISFVSARIGTFLAVEEAGLWIAVRGLKVDNIQLWVFNGTLMAKVFLAFFAVLLNYVLSKCWIFKIRNED